MKLKTEFGCYYCPLLSAGREDPVECLERFCNWWDDELEECAISRINGNTKNLLDINKKLV